MDFVIVYTDKTKHHVADNYTNDQLISDEYEK